MKIYLSALLLTIGVVLHFGVSSSMPSSPPNQPISQRRTQPMYIPRHQDEAVYDNDGQVVAIFFNHRRFNMNQLEFEEKDPNGILDQSWLSRAGPGGFLGKYHKHRVYYMYDLHHTEDTIEPKRNDLVLDPTGMTIVGMFGDNGRYYEIVQRKI